jgi:hypothetical protein
MLRRWAKRDARRVWFGSETADVEQIWSISSSPEVRQSAAFCEFAKSSGAIALGKAKIFN